MAADTMERLKFTLLNQEISINYKKYFSYFFLNSYLVLNHISIRLKFMSTLCKTRKLDSDGILLNHNNPTVRNLKIESDVTLLLFNIRISQLGQSAETDQSFRLRFKKKYKSEIYQKKVRTGRWKVVCSVSEICSSY